MISNVKAYYQNRNYQHAVFSDSSNSSFIFHLLNCVIVLLSNSNIYDETRALQLIAIICVGMK